MHVSGSYQNCVAKNTHVIYRPHAMQAWLQTSLAQRPFQEVLEISDDEEITKEPIVSKEIIAQLIQEYLKFFGLSVRAY